MQFDSFLSVLEIVLDQKLPILRRHSLWTAPNTGSTRAKCDKVNQYLNKF
jgi:hypothetical protein